MISRTYMVAQPPPPTTLKRFLDQEAFPWAINAAGAVESVLWRVSEAARRQPVVAVFAALALGAAASSARRRSRRR